MRRITIEVAENGVMAREVAGTAFVWNWEASNDVGVEAEDFLYWMLGAVGFEEVDRVEIHWLPQRKETK